MRKQEQLGNLAAALGIAFEGMPCTLKALSTLFFDIQNRCNGATPAPVLAGVVHVALLSHRTLGHVCFSRGAAINLIIRVFHAAPSPKGQDRGINLWLRETHARAPQF